MRFWWGRKKNDEDDYKGKNKEKRGEQEQKAEAKDTNKHNQKNDKIITIKRRNNMKQKNWRSHLFHKFFF